MRSRILLAFAFILSGAAASLGQNKFSHSLAEYDIPLQIDTSAWRRVTYEEMVTLYRKQKLNFDDFLQQEKATALFVFVPKDSAVINDQTSVTIGVNLVPSGSKPVTARDTIETGKPFLQHMRGGLKDRNNIGSLYIDKTTGSLVSKNSVIVVERAKPIDENSKVCYLVTQQKDKGPWRVQIEYRCFTKDEDAYFPLFERIISSFR